MKLGMEAVNELNAQWKEVGAACAVPTRSLTRWVSRIRDGREPVEIRGPKKVEPLDLQKLQRRVSSIAMGPKRVKDKASLVYEYRDSCSRREMQKILNEEKASRRKSRGGHDQKLKWITPGLVWSIDETEFKISRSDKTSFVNMRDLSSQYKMNPMVGKPCLGVHIAQWLDKQFSTYGPPLFLKRDNGSNFRAAEVDKVLEKFWVIPISSPPYYSQYNGAVEHDHGEIKKLLRLKNSPDHIPEVIHELNHRSRRKLNGQTSCSLFASRDLSFLTKRARKSIYNDLIEQAQKAIRCAGRNLETELRKVAVSWLISEGHLEVI